MRDFTGLLKIAGVPPLTVGDVMNRWNGDLGADGGVRRDAFGRIVSGGLDVKDRASRLPYVLGGGLLGRQAAKYMGAGKLWQGVGAAVGAAVGNAYYNRSNPADDPLNRRAGYGVVGRGW